MSSVDLCPGELKQVSGRVHIDVPIPQQAAAVHALGPYIDRTVTVITSFVGVENGNEVVSFQVCNHGTKPVTLQKKTAVGELMQVHVVDVTTLENLAAKDESFLTNFSLDHINSVVGQRGKDFLLESAPDFTKHNLDLGRTSVCRHGMNMIDPVTWKDKTWQIPPSMYDEVKQHLRQMIDLGVMRPL